MSGNIQILSETGEILIGARRLRCEIGTDASISLLGRRVTPLTLAERQHLMSVFRSTGDRGHRSLARLFALASVTPPLSSGPLSSGSKVFDAGSSEALLSEADATAALEAIALHLAGASQAGSLDRTALLVSRALGDTGFASVTALEADQLADSLARSILGLAQGQFSSSFDGDSEGWTSIQFTEPSGPRPGSTNAGSPEAGLSEIAAIRDDLASMLLQRATAELEAEVGAALVEVPLTVGGRAGEADGTGSGGLTRAGVGLPPPGGDQPRQAAFAAVTDGGPANPAPPFAAGTPWGTSVETAAFATATAQEAATAFGPPSAQGMSARWAADPPAASAEDAYSGSLGFGLPSPASLVGSLVPIPSGDALGAATDLISRWDGRSRFDSVSGAPGRLADEVARVLERANPGFTPPRMPGRSSGSVPFGDSSHESTAASDIEGWMAPIGARLAGAAQSGASTTAGDRSHSTPGTSMTDLNAIAESLQRSADRRGLPR